MLTEIRCEGMLAALGRHSIGTLGMQRNRREQNTPGALKLDDIAVNFGGVSLYKPTGVLANVKNNPSLFD